MLLLVPSYSFNITVVFAFYLVHSNTDNLSIHILYVCLYAYVLYSTHDKFTRLGVWLDKVRIKYPNPTPNLNILTKAGFLLKQNMRVFDK